MMNSTLTTIMDQSETGNLTFMVSSYSYINEPYSVKFLRLCLVSLFAILGFFGNLWVSIQVFQRSTRSPVAYYIRNLALADMGVLSLSFPIAIIKEQMSVNWPLGSVFCQYFYPFTEVFHGASIWSIAAIAAERYRGMQMRSPRQPNFHGKPTYVKYVLLAIWLSSFTFTSLPLFFVMKYQENKFGKFCTFGWDPWMQVAYVGTLTTLWYLLPLAVVSSTYIYIAGLLRRSSTFHRRKLETFDKFSSSMRKRLTTEMRRLRENKRARKILTPLILVFAITMLPLNTLRLMVSLFPEVTRWKYFLVVYNLSVIAIVVNSASNPVIYSIVTKDFCQCSFRCFWSCCHEQKNDSNLLKRKRQNYIQNVNLQERTPKQKNLRVVKKANPLNLKS